MMSNRNVWFGLGFVIGAHVESIYWMWLTGMYAFMKMAIFASVFVALLWLVIWLVIVGCPKNDRK